MKVTIPALLLASLLVACGNDTPSIKLTGPQTVYFGTWEHAGSEYGNNVESDNMLLVFHEDSKVSYKRCINHLNSHNYTSLGDMEIKKLTDTELVIRGSILFIHITRDLQIGRRPYVEGDESYFELDGLKLRKLKNGESSTHDSWKCDSKS